jgi:hypothetical protein
VFDAITLPELRHFGRCDRSIRSEDAGISISLETKFQLMTSSELVVLRYCVLSETPEIFENFDDCQVDGALGLSWADFDLQ